MLFFPWTNLIASAWSSQPWFPLLLSLLDKHPWHLPLTCTLMWQPQSLIFHLDPQHLSLHAWRLSSPCSSIDPSPMLVARCITSCHRLSTQSVYDRKCRIFMERCQELGHDPFTITTLILADFLTHLITVKNFAPVTITGYRTPVGSTLELGRESPASASQTSSSSPAWSISSRLSILALVDLLPTGTWPWPCTCSTSLQATVQGPAMASRLQGNSPYSLGIRQTSLWASCLLLCASPWRLV